MPWPPAACLVALLALALAASACNFSYLPTGQRRELTLQAIRLTMTSVPPPSTPAPSAVLQATATVPPVAQAAEPAFPVVEPSGAVFSYASRPGDTLMALAGRFGVEPEVIASGTGLPLQAYLPAGLTWEIPNVLQSVSPAGMLLPDGAVVFGPAAAEFEVDRFVLQAGGFLLQYRETLEEEQVLTGAQIVEKVAAENSVDPRLLLVLLETRAGWVSEAQPRPGTELYPIGFRIPGRSGLYQELSVAATQLNRAYYGWRSGTRVEESFTEASALRLHPTLNAGSVALIHLFAQLSTPASYTDNLVGEAGFLPTYRSMFGDPIQSSAAGAGPLSPEIAQPILELPFSPGERWSLTAGPHNAWNAGTPRGALDFSPITNEESCAVSVRWVTASAPGIIARSEDNAVVLDFDGDGLEQTGWVLLYYHLADEGRIASGMRVLTGDRLGHPSCEGGRTTGKHVHLARRYNGEWLEADGAIPFVLSGWRAVADARNYYGTLVRGDEVVTSDSSGRSGSTILR